MLRLLVGCFYTQIRQNLLSTVLRRLAAKPQNEIVAMEAAMDASSRAADMVLLTFFGSSTLIFAVIVKETERIRTLCQGWLPFIVVDICLNFFIIAPVDASAQKFFSPFGVAVTAGFRSPVGDELVLVDIIVLHLESNPYGSAIYPVGVWRRGACDQWLLLGVIKGRHDLESSAFASDGADVVPVAVTEVASDILAFNHLRRGAIA